MKIPLIPNPHCIRIPVKNSIDSRFLSQVPTSPCQIPEALTQGGGCRALQPVQHGLCPQNSNPVTTKWNESGGGTVTCGVLDFLFLLAELPIFLGQDFASCRIAPLFDVYQVKCE